jgi:hypothetical protein
MEAGCARDLRQRRHWKPSAQEIPISLFFLNETLGWMVTEDSGGPPRWRGTEAAEVARSPFRVYFADEKNGWAACSKKTVLRNPRWRRKWTPIKEAAEPPGVPERSGYTWIAFPTPQSG